MTLSSEHPVAGYDEKFRKLTLKNAMRIHDSMVKEQEQGIKPLNRPKDWNKEERRRKKVDKSERPEI